MPIDAKKIKISDEEKKEKPVKSEKGEEVKEKEVHEVKEKDREGGLKEQLKAKEKEITELKQLLAEAEAEIKEFNDFQGFEKPKPGILESRALNRVVKWLALLIICALIIFAGAFPWLFGDKLFNRGENQEKGTQQAAPVTEEASDQSVQATPPNPDQAATSSPVVQETTTAEVKEDAPVQSASGKVIEVSSDLGWLNVRNQPDAKTGEIIKKINSGETYEWLEKIDTWYKIKLDSQGNVGYVSGEYVKER